MLPAPSTDATGYIDQERLAYNVIFPAVRSVERYGCSLEVTINCSKPELKQGQQRPKNVLAPGATTPISAENVGFKPGLRVRALTACVCVCVLVASPHHFPSSTSQSAFFRPAWDQRPSKPHRASFRAHSRNDRGETKKASVCGVGGVCYRLHTRALFGLA